jgi:hypothetical protein
MTEQSDLEIMWENLLSRNPERIRAAFSALTPKEQESILVHLNRMATESGWHPEQRRSAEAAVLAIKSQDE